MKNLGLMARYGRLLLYVQKVAHHSARPASLVAQGHHSLAYILEAEVATQYIEGSLEGFSYRPRTSMLPTQRVQQKAGTGLNKGKSS